MFVSKNERVERRMGMVRMVVRREVKKIIFFPHSP
jgi:hypothetical protein